MGCLADTTPWADTPRQTPPPEQTLLPNACWGIPPPGGHCSGRYAPYWNVFLYFATNALVKVNLMFKHLQDFVGGKGVNMIVEMRADTNMDNDVKLLAKFGRIMVCKL